jgi:hypothetical protein
MKSWVRTQISTLLVKPDLTHLSQCDVCLAAALQVKQKLVSLDGNFSNSLNCFYFTILYKNVAICSSQL